MVRLAQTHHAERAHSVLDSYMEVSICKEWMSLQEGLLLTQQVRILKSQRFVRRHKGYLKSTLRAEQHLWQSHAEQGRCGCQLCVSLLCFLGEPWGSARLAGDPHPVLQPLLWTCTCCISTGSLEDIPGSPWQGRESIPEWTCCRLSNAFLDLCDKDSGDLSSVGLRPLW